MGYGIVGNCCRKCGLKYDTYWNSVTWQFPDGKCPECGSTDVEKLPDTVGDLDEDGLLKSEKDGSPAYVRELRAAERRRLSQE